jgi:hypothetical protein
MEEVKKCPYCGEEVLAVAKKCKHCGEWLDEAAKKDLAKQETVKVDSNKLENLYKVARRARKDENSVQAFKNYELLQMEDPNNWEPLFFVAYYSAVNTLKNDSPGDSVRVSGNTVSLGGNYRSGLDPAINMIVNCLDSVFDLIENIEHYEEQKTAVETVSDYVQSIAESLKSIIQNESLRMVDQISNYSKQIEGGLIQTERMYNKNSKMRKAYDEDVSNMIVLIENRKVRLEDVVGKRRIDEYWNAHQDEKKALDSEKQSLNEQITKLKKDIKAISGYTEMIDSQKQLEQEKNNAISIITKPKTGLLTFGIVAGIVGAFFTLGISLVVTIFCWIVRSQTKKSYKAQQANVESEFKKKLQTLNEKYSHVISDVGAINKNIVPLENRILAIDDELTRPR